MKDIVEHAVFKDENGLVPLDNLPKTYPTNLTIKSTTDAEVEHDAFNSNALILESSVWEIQSVLNLLMWFLVVLFQVQL